MIHPIKKRPTVVAAARQAGLTLIELTIVLLILIGLSGLLLPFVQGFVDKTHDSANTDSLKEVSKQFLSYSNLYSGYPENLDSLIVGTAGLAPGGVATTGLTPAVSGNVMPAMINPGLFSSHPLTLAEAQQLGANSITKVMDMWGDAGDGNHTLKATDTSRALVAAGVPVGNVAVINETLLNNAMGATGGAVCSVAPSTPATALTILPAVATGAPMNPFLTTGDDALANQCLAELLNKTVVSPANPTGIDVSNNIYVVMGIGNDNSMIGRTMSEAPIHFAKVGGMNAANKYNRILAVFELREGRKDMHPAAKFVGTLMPMMKIEGIAQAQGAYYKGDGA
jgi:type II secretory pathway pseudopilin PulG